MPWNAACAAYNLAVKASPSDFLFGPEEVTHALRRIGAAHHR